MRSVWIGCLVLTISGVVRAEVKKPDKDFWRTFVAPQATETALARAVLVYPAQSRELGPTDRGHVIRLDRDRRTFAGRVGGCVLQPTQVAVTREGLHEATWMSAAWG